jgi:hypothetical protein
MCLELAQNKKEDNTMRKKITSPTWGSRIVSIKLELKDK